MNTLETDFLIAKYMGGLQNNESRLSLQKNQIWLPKHGVCDLGNNGKILKYSSSWDWLIDVVEKIESLGFYVKTVKTTCLVLDVDEKCISIELNRLTKIDAVYNACVEFIKWYNENKSKINHH